MEKSGEALVQELKNNVADPTKPNNQLFIRLDVIEEKLKNKLISEIEPYERNCLICDKCGSEKFTLIAVIIISDVVGIGDDIIAERTIEKETIIKLRCFECGHQIRPEVDET